MNIYINSNSLNEVIASLKNSNNNINDTLNAIYENINKLTDESVWKSPEKEVIITPLIQYIEDSKESISNDFNSCLSVLEAALKEYMEGNKMLEKKANDLPDVEVL